jgi:predicted DsbA family dithiol-disulfide isomerase
MLDTRLRLYFDFVDPGSFLLLRRLDSLGVDYALDGFEMRPPPAPPVDPSDPTWSDYWDSVAPALRELDVEPALAARVPWTRKAHELAVHASEAGAPGAGRRMVERLFRAFVEDGVDLGRIDLLVEMAEAEGLDRTEARAVLDVDRYRDTVDDRRRAAVDRGVRGVPTLLQGDRRLEGIHDVNTLRAFIGDD